MNSTDTILTDGERLALARYKAAYCLAAEQWRLGLTDREATRWQLVRWLVATGRLGTDDQAAAEVD